MPALEGFEGPADAALHLEAYFPTSDPSTGLRHTGQAPLDHKLSHASALSFFCLRPRLRESRDDDVKHE